MITVRLSAKRTGLLHPPGNIPGTHFCLRLSRSQGHSAAERVTSIPMTPSGIEPATFRLVARCLNQLRHQQRAPLSYPVKSNPITGLDRPRGFQEVEAPRFQDILHMGCQPYAPAAFTPRKHSWYSFLLKAESTPGP